MGKVHVLGNIVRNIVAVLGFVPAESLILVLVRGGALDSVMRMDLRDAATDGAAVRLAQLVDRQAADGVVVVVVSEKAAACTAGAERVRAMVGDVESELERRGYPLYDAVMVDRVEAGGHWSCIDDNAIAGVLEDPASSELAAAVVAAGQRMFDSRAELEEFVAVDVERVAAVVPLLGEVRPVEDVATSVRAAVDAMRLMADGEDLTDAALAEVGASLVDVRVRDALLHVGGSEATAAAEHLWTALARVLPGPFRAEALTLLAFSAFRRGSGVVAAVALEAALSANPGHRLAGALDAALQSGMRPEQLSVLVAGIPPAVTV
ncbi:DUF4192 domain-containing protein [Mycolicibacterium fortuitum]|uniref:DUF4192 domain-containing protein n=1 Tax=Mycolicibacterium fortuitum TaxID=1766 RepID=UPI001CE092D3|nr:DUF4192 domain-containing protein [Mycolicibacterium fortuitum]MCA4727222.1 DUF4192 domain-containing protein [Mycolicibacterium fortuitum]